MKTQPRMTAMQLRNSRRRKREDEATKSVSSAETIVSVPEPTTSVLFSTTNNIVAEDRGAEVKGSRRPFASYDPARGGHVVDDESFQVKKLEYGETDGSSIGGLEMQKQPPRRRPAIEAITDFVLEEQVLHHGHKPPSKTYSEINWIKNSARSLKLPLELCMRSKVRFEAPQGSLKELNSFAPIHELAGLQKLTGVVENRHTASLMGIEAAKSDFFAARLYWMYPATSLPAEALQCQSVALSNMLSDPSRAVQQFSCGAASHFSSLAGGWSTFFSTRRRDWEEAFRGLFCTLRDGDPAEGEDLSFYLRCPGLSVVWCREQGGEAELVAVVSRSNRAFRERLRTADIEFSLPLDDRPDRDALEATENDHTEDFSVVGVKHGQYKFPQDPPSAPYKTLLRIRGPRNVYRLFDMFLEIGSGLNVSTGGGLGQLAAISGISSSKTLDVPLLLSRRPFMGATLRCLQTKLLPDKRQVEPVNGKADDIEDRQNKSQHGGGGDIVSTLEVMGPVMPSALSEMATAATIVISSFMNLKGQTDWQVLLTPKMDYESAYLGFADHHALQDSFVCHIKGMNGSDSDSPSFNFGVRKHHIATG